MNIGTAISRINHVIRTGDVFCEQLVQHGYFSVACRGSNNAVDLSRRLIQKFGSENVIPRNDTFKSRMDHFHRRGGKHVKIKKVSVHSARQNLVKQLDITFQADPFSHFVKMLFSHLSFEFRVMEQKVRQFSSLLHQVNLCHALSFAFKLRGRNTDQFGQHVAGIVEGECLVKIAGKNVALQELISHMILRFAARKEGPFKESIGIISLAR